MSFGFSVGDFLAVGNLCMKLYRSFKDVPDTFNEIGRELSSFYIVLCDLEHQASDPESLLNRRGASQKNELLQLRDNLNFTMEELDGLFQTYTRIGRSAWRRIQLSQKDLEKPRRDLLFHMSAINGFISSLTMAAVGRMEQNLEGLESLIRDFLLRDRGRAQTLRSEAPGREETWDLIRMTLASENIVLEEHEDEVRTVIESVMEEEFLGTERRSSSESSRPQDEVVVTERRHQSTKPQANGHIQSKKHPKQRASKATKSSVASIPSDTTEDDVKMVLLNNGFDIEHLWKTSSSPVLKMFRRALLSHVRKKNPPEVRALDWSAKNGYVKGVRLLLEKGVSLQPRDRQHRLALVQAASCGYFGVVNLLLEHGASTRAVFSISPSSRWAELDGLSALHASAKKGHIDIVRLLLRYGANFNLIDNRGWTPLCMAVCEGHVEVIRALVTKGASTESAATKESLLHIAAESNRPGVVRLLLEYGEDPMKMFMGETPLDVAIFRNYVSVAKELLDMLVHAGDRPRLGPYLHQIVTLDNSIDRSQLLEMLLESGVYVDCWDGSPPETSLYRAICEDKEQMVQILLGHGAFLKRAWLIAVSRKNETAMRKAVAMGVNLRASGWGIDALELMIEPRPNCPELDTTPRPFGSLSTIDQKSDIEGLRLLLTLGLRLGGPDNYGGKELLHVASRFCDIDAVKLLIAEGVKFDNTTADGRQILSEIDPDDCHDWDHRKDILPLLRSAAIAPEG
jgi:ankyrin repeat protein